MQNSVVMCTISDFDRKYHFWVNLDQKIKIISLSLKFGTQNYIEYAKFNGNVQFFCFRAGIPYLGNLVQEI